MDGISLLSPQELERGAAHEAGHVVVGFSLGLDLDYVTLLDKSPPVASISRGVTLWKNLDAQLCAVQCFVTAAGMAGEQLALGQFSENHAEGDLAVLVTGGRSAQEIVGDRTIAFCVLKRNVNAHDALAKELRCRFRMNPASGGLIQAEEALCIFKSNHGNTSIPKKYWQRRNAGYESRFGPGRLARL